MSHLVLQDSYHNRPSHEDRESEKINLTCKNQQMSHLKWGNNPQPKGMEESSEKELNEKQASNLLDIEFKVKVIRMLKLLRTTGYIMGTTGT